jgi:hypothetical protein
MNVVDLVTPSKSVEKSERHPSKTSEDKPNRDKSNLRSSRIRRITPCEYKESRSRSQRKSKCSNLSIVIQSMKQEERSQKRNEIFEIMEPSLKILGVSKDGDGCLKYKIQNQNRRLETLRRAQLIQRNFLALINYYEDHLDFVDESDSS